MPDAMTLTALDHDGAEITFTDFVSEGMRVDLWKDPDLERGFLGGRIVYRDGDDWRLRKLTETERTERFLNIRQHLDLEPGGVPSDKPRSKSPFAAASREQQPTSASSASEAARSLHSPETGDDR